MKIWAVQTETMTFAQPCYPNIEVRRAGENLVNGTASEINSLHAVEVMNNWRASHGYVLNTFQSTLRTKLSGVDKNWTAQPFVDTRRP